RRTDELLPQANYRPGSRFVPAQSPRFGRPGRPITQPPKHPRTSYGDFAGAQKPSRGTFSDIGGKPQGLLDRGVAVQVVRPSASAPTRSPCRLPGGASRSDCTCTG